MSGAVTMSLLKFLHRLGQRVARGSRPQVRPPFPRRAIFEALEPRVLLSASPTLVGTPFDDNDISGYPAIYGTLGDDVIDALGGDDYVYGDGNTSGPIGNDIIVGGDGRDLLFGEEGDDWLEPGPMPQPVLANQTVDGGNGLDILFLLGAPTSYQFYEYTDGGFIADATIPARPKARSRHTTSSRWPSVFPRSTTPTGRRSPLRSSTSRSWWAGGRIARRSP
jgi:hypothetical protein